MTIRRITPVLVVDAVEPCRDFWTGRFGFACVAEVPHGESLGFAMLVQDGLELMYQSRASVRDDQGRADLPPASSSVLYIEVDDLAAAERACADLPLRVAKRTTFYGATEFGVDDPAGNLVVFAQQADAG
ncbi:MAG: hypothetical protein NW201_05970 [Gemmatimonadales bacterium]|nr:hypothetical protein [Gemmatimonadales bacterium]